MDSLIESIGPLGFKVWRNVVSVMERSHLHSDIEINFVMQGEVEYFFGGRFQVLKTDELAVFWAGMPHVLTRTTPQTEMVWGVVPLAWFLQWELPAAFNDALLRGRMLRFARRAAFEREKFLLWSREFDSAGSQSRKIVALEVEAVLRRMALEMKSGSAHRRTSTPPVQGATHYQIEKLTAFIARHYCEELTIQEIARAAELHPNYAMQLFRERCGLSLWEYVLRLRVSHAQGLLLATDRKIGDIARASGFASESRFYAAFEKYCDQPPRAWRLAMRNQ